MDCVEIYYLNIEKFLPYISESELDLFVDDKIFNSQKRKRQYVFGRLLLRHVLKKYGIDYSNIIIQNKKPCLKNGEIFFSISHSENIVLVAFYKNNIGVDIEYMKERDFSKVSSRYGLTINNHDKIGFYTFWTKFEAEIKLQEKAFSSYSSVFLKDFMLTVSIAKLFDIASSLKIAEVEYEHMDYRSLVIL